jgi:hypothetical protein
MDELLQERAADRAALPGPPMATEDSQGSQTATEYAFAHPFPITRPSSLRFAIT